MFKAVFFIVFVLLGILLILYSACNLLVAAAKSLFSSSDGQPDPPARR